MKVLRPAVLVVAMVAVIEVPVAGQSTPSQNVGSLCVLPHVRKADVMMQSPDVPPAAENYSLRLDNGRWVPLSPDSSVLLADIPRAGRHRVIIRGADKPFSAFAFTFDEFPATDLCLVQNSLYLIWQFHPSSARYAPCRCKGITPIAWTVSNAF